MERLFEVRKVVKIERVVISLERKVWFLGDRHVDAFVAFTPSSSSLTSQWSEFELNNQTITEIHFYRRKDGLETIRRSLDGGIVVEALEFQGCVCGSWSWTRRRAGKVVSRFLRLHEYGKSRSGKYPGAEERGTTGSRYSLF
jgi:hypothetical protein